VGLALSPQLTGEDGTFVSYPLAPGEVHLEATHEDYDTIPTTAMVQDGRDTTVDLLLAPRPKESKVRVRAVDEHGAAVPNLSVHAVGPATRDATAAADGALVSLPAGDYALTIEAPEFLAKERSITVEPMRDQNLEVTLRRRPQQTHVTITREAIVIRGTIHFGTNNAIILPDGQQLLDEVVDVLTKNPQIRKVSIEGHTDNRGSAARNLRLSKARAEAVRTYLIKEGISPMRLTATGFGASRPLVPNLSPANRAHNRRVEFRIIEQSGE
jgi:outer membrane protein OmpA-like peptidoglycan-associated protein